MAQFRLSLAIASRSAGCSVVAMAAYRAGCRLRDNRADRVHDYARRRGVAYAGIVLPDNAPAWARDREQLWNRVEEREGRSDALLGRELQLSLPHELGEEQRRELALAFARHLAAEYGVAVDVAIHTPSKLGDSRNHHAHLLLTSRAFDAHQPSGWAKAKDRRLDAIAMRRAGAQTAAEGLREKWQTMQNAALASAGVRDAGGDPVQVDRRSYKRQGLNIQAGRHEGPEATALKRRREGGSRTARLREGNAVKNSHAVKNSNSRRAGLFSKSRHPAEAIRAFNQELAASPPDAKTLSGNAEAGVTKRLNTDPLSIDLPLRDAAPQKRPQPVPPWRWHGLDALNQELAEMVEEERRKEREGRGGRQFTGPDERLDTDPRPGDFVQTVTPNLEPDERRGFGRGGW